MGSIADLGYFGDEGNYLPLSRSFVHSSWDTLYTKNKYTKKKLCARLVLFTRLKKNALCRYPVQPPVVLWPTISS